MGKYDDLGATLAPPAPSADKYADLGATQAPDYSDLGAVPAPKVTAQDLAQRDHSEIFQHAAQYPEDFETAYQADKLRRARPFTSKLGDVASAVGGAIAHPIRTASGVGNFLGGLVEAPLHSLEWWKSPETQQAENTLAAQHGEESVKKIGRSIYDLMPHGSSAVDAGVYASDPEAGMTSPMTPEQRTAYDDQTARALFAQRVQAAKNEMQLARGEPLDTGAIAGIYNTRNELGKYLYGQDFPTETPSQEVGPTALKASGVEPVSQGSVERMAAASDPLNLGLAAAPGLPGAATIGGGATELAGKALQVPGRIASAIPGRIGQFARGGAGTAAVVESALHPAAAATTAAGVAGAKGLQSLGRILESQGKELRTGTPSELTTKAATAAVTGESALGTNIARKIGDVTAKGAATAAGFAPVNAALAEGDPKAFGESEVGAGVFGGTLGAFMRNRPMLVEAARPHLQSEGARALAEASAGNDPLAQKSAAYVMSLPEEARARTLEAIGALQGLPTQTPNGPVRSKLYVLNGEDYQNVIAQKFGMQQAAMGGGRGFYIGDDGAAYVNGDYHTTLGPDELNHTIGHEFGGHSAINVMRAAGAKGGALYNGLIGAAKDALMPGGKVTPAFYRFVKRYNVAFDPTGQTERLSFNDPEAIEEFIAEQAGQLMAGKGAGELALPKNIQDRISDGIGRFMGSMVGMDTRKVGTETHFGREEIGALSKAVQDTLGQVVGMKQRGGAEIPEPAKTDTTRIAELNHTLATPRPPAGSPLEAVRQWIKDQKDARAELSSLTANQPAPFPAAGTSPVAPSAPIVPPTAPAPVRARVAAALRQNGIPAAEANQWAQQAQGATTEEMILDALKRRGAQKFPTQTPKVSPQSENPAPAVLPPAATTEATTPTQPATSPTEMATSPSNASPTQSAPEVNLSPVTTETATIPPGSPTETEPAPLSEDSIGEIAAKAEQAVVAARAGTKKKAHTLPKEVSDAQVDAVAAAHEQGLPANYQGVRNRTDALGKNTISGTFNPSRPFDAFLLKLADLSEKHVGILQDLQSKLGQTVTVNYGHAPVEGYQPTAEERRTAQKASTAQDRASGEAAQQNEDKNFIPLQVTFNKGKDSPSITVLGASPEKLLNNFNLTSAAVTELGGDVPYRDIHDPHLVADMKGIARNHANGWKGDGSARIESFPDVNVPTPAEGYTPYQIPVERFEFLNTMLGDESAKTGKTKTTPEQQMKQGLAVKNQIPMTEAGEVNMLRESINRPKGPVTDAQGNETTWSKATIENPLSEALRVDLINEVKPEVSNEDASIRPHGYAGDISRFFGEGSPNRTFSAAGFLPDTGAPKTTQEKARDRIAAGGKSDTAAFMPDRTPATMYVASREEHGGETPIPFYAASNEDYARNFGKNVRKVTVSAKNPLDLTHIDPRDESGIEKLKASLKENGISTEGLAIYRDDEPPQALDRNVKEIAARAKTAGFDSIKLNEYVEGGGEDTTMLIIDKSALHGGKFMPDDSTPKEGEATPSGQAPSGSPQDHPSTEGTSTNNPVDESNRNENLMQEAEAAGIEPSLELTKGVLRRDPQSMDKLRKMIMDKTGRPARFMPSTRPNTKEAARQRIAARTR